MRDYFTDGVDSRLVAEGDHVARGEGFVAIRDIAPIAETHLLVLPERHVDTFRDVDAFPDNEAGRMLRFVAGTARDAGLEDYRVLVNVGPGAGQTVFHLHVHIIPRKEGEALKPHAGKMEDQAVLAVTAEKIRAKLKA